MGEGRIATERRGLLQCIMVCSAHPNDTFMTATPFVSVLVNRLSSLTLMFDCTPMPDTLLQISNSIEASNQRKRMKAEHEDEVSDLCYDL